MRRQHLVERVDHLRDAQVLDAADRAGEVIPERAQHVLVGQLVVGNLVELLLEARGEIVLDVLLEEVLQERGEHPPFVLGDEALLVEPHIAAVAEHLQDRGIGRGPADAELFHALDQRRFGIARRRLGEMLGRLDLALRQRLAGRHRGEAVRILLVRLVVGVLGVELGVRVSATSAENSTAAASVKPNSRNRRPMLPGRNEIGTNTAASTMVVAMTAKPISRVPFTAATIGASPSSVRRCTFSSTTIASSTTRPIASTNPSSVSTFTE